MTYLEEAAEQLRRARSANEARAGSVNSWLTEGAVPVLTETATGFVNGDSASLLTGTLGTTATASSATTTARPVTVLRRSRRSAFFSDERRSARRVTTV